MSADNPRRYPLPLDVEGLERFAELIAVVQRANDLGFEVDARTTALYPTSKWRDRTVGEMLDQKEAIEVKLRAALADLQPPVVVPATTNGAGDSVPHVVADAATGVVTS